MAVGYILVNNTKKECINYLNLPASTKKELAGNDITASITTWYLLNNTGDNISFVPDSYDLGSSGWPLNNISRETISNYNDVTEIVIKELIANKIFSDEGKEIFDKNEPNIYIRKLRNIWFE